DLDVDLDDEEEAEDVADVDDESEEEESDGSTDTGDDNSIDPELAREKFYALREQHEKALQAIQKHGRSHKKSREQIQALSDI
ncbi:RNA polymerase sigma factor RpoD, partial [Xanthomonas citri pv. citri]|nr:RNA polymerase sigma factor RpoD [Xanthomonas citri pv. citri]